MSSNGRLHYGYDQGGIPVESMMPKQALSSEQMKYAIENVKSIGYTVDREQYVNIISGYSIIFQPFLVDSSMI